MGTNGAMATTSTLATEEEKRLALDPSSLVAATTTYLVASGSVIVAR